MSDVIDQLKVLNPTATSDPENELDDAGREFFVTLASGEFAGEERPGGRRVAARWMLGVAATILVGAFLVARPWPSGPEFAVAARPALLSYSAIEPVPSKQLAGPVIAATSALNEPIRPTSYTRTAGWYYNMTGSGNSLETQTIERWVGPDGKLTARQMDGSVSTGDNVTWDRPAPTSPDALLKFLKIGHPIDKMGSGELLVAIADYYSENNPNPAQRAAILRLLSQTENVFGLGDVTDRAGRDGIAFGVDTAMSGAPSRLSLIFDPGTGQLLGQEEVAFALTNDGSRLDEPVVVSYTSFFPPADSDPARPR